MSWTPTDCCVMSAEQSSTLPLDDDSLELELSRVKIRAGSLLATSGARELRQWQRALNSVIDGLLRSDGEGAASGGELIIDDRQTSLF